MSVVSNNILAGASGQGGGGYEIERSLRFNSADSAYLTRTPSAAGNQKTWTWSGWVKLADITNQTFIFAAGSSPYVQIYTDSSKLYIQTNQGYLLTTQVFRDPSAWQHWVFAFDTTQATAANRVKFYINGTEVTTWNVDQRSSITQNVDTGVNATVSHAIGKQVTGSGFSNAYLANIHFIDGQALAPTDFGETDDNGVWQPKEFAGTYGPLVDQSQTWSSLGTGTPDSASTNWNNSFDGTISTSASGLTYGASGATMTWTVSPITVTSSVVIYAYLATGNESSLRLNDSVNPTNATNAYGAPITFTAAQLGGSLSKIELIPPSSGAGCATSAIEVDGKLLVDSGVTVADNSFHLPFSDNSSSAALGLDYSQGTPGTNNKGMEVVTWTGNGGDRDIGGLAFQPDFVWIKKRNSSSSGDHMLYDVVRGATKVLKSNSSAAEITDATTLHAFNSDGFSIDGGWEVNKSGDTYVGWAWKAGGAAVSNTDGSVTSQVSASTDYGFSICTFTSPSSGNFTLGHGLSSVPSLIFMKEKAAGRNWHIFHSSISTGTDKYLRLNGTNSTLTYSNVWGDALPTSSVFGLGVSGSIDANAEAVAYVWSEVAGFSKFGTFVHSGSASSVTGLGFKPRFILVKDTNVGEDWRIFDSERGSSTALYPNTSGAEGSGWAITFNDDGFSWISGSFASGTYIYAAFAANPANDWTVNNLSVAAGANNDSLVDTPTNGTQTDTGAGGEVVGNYATLNPLAGGAPTNGNLHQPNNSAINYATIGVSSGKWYFETTIDTQTAGGVKIGVAQAFNTGEIGDSSTGWAILGQSNSDGGKGVHAGALTSSYTTYAQGDIVNCAFDMDSGKIYWGKNGTWLNSGNPATGAGAIYNNVSGTVFPAATANQGGALTWNFGQRPFAYTAPSGYKALCTSNLPTPTIADGSQYFDTKLYSGTGSSQNITGLNFSPDFVWTKARSHTDFHTLIDVVRGSSKTLYSNDAAAEGTDATGITAFNSDGYSLGANTTAGSVNASGRSYASWSWDAGSSNTTIAAGSLNSSLYNQSDNWSSRVTGTPFSGYSVATMFDGSASGICYANTGSSITFTPTTPITVTSSIRIYGAQSSSTEFIKINDNAATNVPSNVGWFTPDTGTAITSLSKLEFYTTNGSYASGVGAIEIDGKLLVDASVSITTPSIASTARSSPESGFSIVTYTGNATAGATIGHALNAAPELIFIKSRSITGNWIVYSKELGSGNSLFLDLTNAGSATSNFNYTSPTSSTLTVSSSGEVNASGATYLALCFAPIEGYSAMGSYVGNGSADGPFVFTGFKPAWLMFKETTGGSDHNWFIFDSKRNTFNVLNEYLEANLAATANTHSTVDFLSNGFKFRTSNNLLGNGSGDTYIYLAFAEHPFKTARAR